MNQCLNCEATLQGPFCSACGQRDRATEPSTREWLKLIWDDYIAFDSKLLHSIYGLFFPGKLTLEWVKGKQQSYITPIRFYIFWSFVLAAIQFLTPEHSSFISGLFEGLAGDHSEFTQNHWYDVTIQFCIVLFIPSIAIAADIIDKKRSYIVHCIFCCHLWLSLATFYTINLVLFKWIFPSFSLGETLYFVALGLLGIGAITFILVAIKNVYLLSWFQTINRGTRFILAAIFSWLFITSIIFLPISHSFTGQ